MGLDLSALDDSPGLSFGLGLASIGGSIATALINRNNSSNKLVKQAVPAAVSTKPTNWTAIIVVGAVAFFGLIFAFSMVNKR